MKKIFPVLVLSLGLCLHKPLHAQTHFPSYIDVLTQFYKQYSFSKDLLPDGVNFAKMRDGWHCQVVNQITEEVKTDEIFWDAASKKFILLAAFQAPDDLAAEDNVSAALEGYNSFSFYSFDRSPYYGYSGWTEDMIADFGSGSYASYTDTVLEALARAYSAHASKFLWYQYGGTNISGDTLKQKLGPLQLPSQQRIDSINYCLGKAIDIYKVLAAKSMTYMTTVGNSAMKLFNEQMNGYMQMMMIGQNELAQNYLRSAKPNETLQAIAYNYLANCPLNTILFSFGDNDTYPLWYVQQTRNFRKDVAVININMLGLPVYVDQLRKNGTIQFSATPAFYGDPAFLYFIKREGPGKTATLSQFIGLLQNKTYPEPSDLYGNMATYPQNSILLNVDLTRFRKINSQPNLAPQVKLNTGDYITNSQLMVLDIINSNLYTHPVCFTATDDLFANCLQMNGMVYQLLPLDSAKTKLNQKISALKTKEYILKTFKPTPGNNFSSGLVAEATLDGAVYHMYYNVATYYNDKGSRDSSVYMLNHLLKAYNNELPFTINKNEIAAVTLDAGQHLQGIKLFMDFIETMYRLHKNPQTTYPYMSRKAVLNTAINIQAVFELSGIDRTRIDEIVHLLNKEGE